MSAWKADALPLGDARFYPRELDFTVMVKSGQAYLRALTHSSTPHTRYAVYAYVGQVSISADFPAAKLTFFKPAPTPGKSM